MAAVRDGAEGSTIEIGPGTFEFSAPLEPKAGMTIRGAGMDRTIITHGAAWNPSTKTLPDPEMKLDGLDSHVHIHHNYLTSSYAIEFVRNGVEIDHNLFDFDVAKDGGNLISGFGKAPAAGPAVFHNNLVSNPGRGLIWINEPYNNLVIRNNHIITRTTVTPRKEGLLGFHRASDFSTFRIVDNIIECRGQSRPLMHNDESYSATIANNALTNVSDTDRYENTPSNAKTGLEEPQHFQCGVHGELAVEGWETHASQTEQK